jgi:hypothetical protein
MVHLLLHKTPNSVSSEPGAAHTDAKNLYVEREVAHLDTTVAGAIEMQTATMDIADYLKQGGQTAGHRELWRLLRTLFKETVDNDELIH